MTPTVIWWLQKLDVLHFICTVSVKPAKRKEWPSTLRLEARLMMDRWRSLFLCAGVNSGREAALSTAADKNMKRKKKKKSQWGKIKPSSVLVSLRWGSNIHTKSRHNLLLWSVILHKDMQVSVELFKQSWNKVGKEDGLERLCLLLPCSPSDRTLTLRDSSSDSSSKGSTIQLCESKCAHCRHDLKRNNTVK